MRADVAGWIPHVEAMAEDVADRYALIQNCGDFFEPGFDLLGAGFPVART
jgi:hypothetical protein